MKYLPTFVYCFYNVDKCSSPLMTQASSRTETTRSALAALRKGLRIVDDCSLRSFGTEECERQYVSSFPIKKAIL